MMIRSVALSQRCQNFAAVAMAVRAGRCHLRGAWQQWRQCLSCQQQLQHRHGRSRSSSILVVKSQQQYGSISSIIAAVAVDTICHSSSITAAATVLERTGDDSVGIITLSLLHPFNIFKCKYLKNISYNYTQCNLRLNLKFHIYFIVIISLHQLVYTSKCNIVVTIENQHQKTFCVFVVVKPNCDTVSVTAHIVLLLWSMPPMQQRNVLVLILL